MELHINFLTTTLAILFDFVGTLFKRELVWGEEDGAVGSALQQRRNSCLFPYLEKPSLNRVLSAFQHV